MSGGTISGFAGCGLRPGLVADLSAALAQTEDPIFARPSYRAPSEAGTRCPGIQTESQGARTESDAGVLCHAPLTASGEKRHAEAAAI
jgi:hypothetical protein